MKSLCRALLVLNVLYCVLAAAEGALPGWHMFESVESLRFQLRDKDDARVDLRDWLPRGANVVDRSELRQVMVFVCLRERARAPFRLIDDGPAGTSATVATVDGDCKVQDGEARDERRGPR